MRLSRRSMLKAAAVAPVGLWLAACDDSDPRGDAATPSEPRPAVPPAAWHMPAEEEPHEATWMNFPGRFDVWDEDLPDVQEAIADIALTIAEFEPVRMLVRPADVDLARDLMGSDIELIEAPVDDLWARDTLPLFVVSDAGELAAGWVRFNGWGAKQVHAGDTQLAGIVADVLGIELIDSGVVGEGGGLETDGAGSLLAARSSWLNDNRNPGWSEAEISAALAELLGAQRLLWVDGIAGEDITDGHIDTLARFASPTTIIHEWPASGEPGETWFDVAENTAAALEDFRTLDGAPYELVALEQPIDTRRAGPEFLASYVNYYVCNGAVIMSEFGDATADGFAAEQLGALYPGREIVALNVDPVSAGGGGIHCATQQQPAV